MILSVSFEGKHEDSFEAEKKPALLLYGDVACRCTLEFVSLSGFVTVTRSKSLA